MNDRTRKDHLGEAQTGIVPDEIYIDFKLGLLVRHSKQLLEKIKSLNNSPRRDKIARELGMITEALVEIASDFTKLQRNTNCGHTTAPSNPPGISLPIHTEV